MAHFQRGALQFTACIMSGFATQLHAFQEAIHHYAPLPVKVSTAGSFTHGIAIGCWQGLSHPGDQPEPLAEEEEEYTDADAVVADILTIARSPVFDSVHSRAARRSLADHLVEEAEHWEVPQTEEEQLRIASAAFDEHRSAQWSCL